MGGSAYNGKVFSSIESKCSLYNTHWVLVTNGEFKKKRGLEKKRMIEKSFYIYVEYGRNVHNEKQKLTTEKDRKESN